MEWVILYFIAAGAGLIGFGIHRDRQYQKWRGTIDTDGVLYVDWGYGNTQYLIESPMPDASTNYERKWQRGLLVVTHKRVAVYRYPQPQPIHTIQPHELQGFWRPEKYHDGDNDMWIHAQIGVSWRILKLRLNRYSMQDLVRTLKAIASEMQTKAYRRHRPYIHRGPAPAFPAQQNLQGAWELDAPVHLYIMPLLLVLFQHGEVHDTFDLTTIQNIAALRRMEGGKPDGLVRFSAGDTDLAFAMDDYEGWASALAEAAKRTLEEPVERKRKSKDEDDEEDDDE